VRVVNDTTFAWRFGRATSHVRSHSWHSYSYSPWTGSRARIREEVQKGQIVGPGMPSVFVLEGYSRKCNLQVIDTEWLAAVIDSR
jgi:hypothetical protein